MPEARTSVRQEQDASGGSPVVLGAGIAGLATAIFARLKGQIWQVYERAPAPVREEHLLWIAPNGLHLLQALGLGEVVARHGYAQEQMRFDTRYLKPLMTLHGAALKASTGFPIIALKRSWLWQALYQKLLDLGGQVHFAHRLEHMVRDDTGLYLNFAEGLRLKAPMVVGADGMGSAVRQSFFPKSKVRYQGIRTWLGKSPSPLSAKYLGKTIEAWGHNGTRFVFTGMPDGLIYWSALERASNYVANQAPLEPQLLPRLQQQYRDYHADVAAILGAADATSIVRCNFGEVLGEFDHGRFDVVLIGDAAHGMPPNMGQGASLALEDAAVLVDEVFTAGNTAAAIASFYHKRRQRVATMRQLANSMNTLFQPQSSLASGLRDFAAALIPDKLTALRMGQLYQPIKLAGLYAH